MRHDDADHVIDPMQWGSRAAAPRFERGEEMRRVIFHHTAFPDHAPADGDREREALYMGAIEHLHLQRGWIAVGYHFVIMPSGRVFAGRPAWAVGAHAASHNRDSIGIAVAGNFELERPTLEAVRSLMALFSRLGGLPLLAHGDLMPTACPGRYLREAVRDRHGSPS